MGQPVLSTAVPGGVYGHRSISSGTPSASPSTIGGGCAFTILATVSNSAISANADFGALYPVRTSMRSSSIGGGLLGFFVIGDSGNRLDQARSTVNKNPRCTARAAGAIIKRFKTCAYCSVLISTRRLSARPAFVVFGATGLLSP